MTYDVELENTLNKKKDNTGFFKAHYDSQNGWMLNNHPNKTPNGSNIKINENECNITPGLRKVFTDTKYETAKSMSDREKVVFRDIWRKTNYKKYKPGKGKMPGRDRYFKYELDGDVRKILILDEKT